MEERLLKALERILGFRWNDLGYGKFACRSCGSLRYVDYGDQDTKPNERREKCSLSCPWHILEEELDRVRDH